METSGRAELLHAHKPVLLLVYLACRGDWVSRDELTGLFWPDSDEAGARHNLRSLLHRARRLPWANGLELETDWLRWQVSSDLSDFKAAISAGNWAKACELHQQQLLGGFLVEDAPGLEEWLNLERESLQGAWRDACLRQARDLRAASRHAEAAELLARYLSHDQLAEDVLVDFMESSAVAGRRERALSAYQRFEANLNAELGLDPLPETRKLAAAISCGLNVVGQTPDHSVWSLPPLLERPVRLVGRSSELAALRDSSARLKLVSGEAGIGKSRLLLEAFPDAILLSSREGLVDSPFYPIVDLIRARLTELPDLGPYLEDLARLVPEVAPEAKPVPVDARLGAARLLEALARLLEGLGSTLVFDDLQWADSGTHEVLALLCARAGVDCVGAYRVGEASAELRDLAASLSRRGELLELHLPGLRQVDVDDLLAAMSGADGHWPRLSAWLFARSAGNPLFALETIKALFDTGVFPADDSDWPAKLEELVDGLEVSALPAAVADLIQRRVSALSGGARRLLQVTSVLGADASPELLASLVGLSDWGLLDAIEEAEAHGLLAGASFVHDVQSQAVYQGLGSGIRERLHAKAAEALVAGQPLSAAEHWLKAGVPQRAAAAFLAATAQFSSRGLYEAVLHLTERALERAPAGEERWRLQLHRAEAFLSTGHFVESRLALSELGEAPLPVELAQQARLAAVHLALRSGDSKLAAAEAEAALEASRTQVPGSYVDALLAMSNVSALTGNQLAVLSELEAAATIPAPRLGTRQRCQLLVNLGWTYCGLERFEEALSPFRRAIAAAKAGGDRYWHVWAVSNLLSCGLELGRPELGLAEAEAVEERAGYDASELLSLNLARAYLRLGRREEAESLYQRLRRESGDPTNRTIALAALSQLLFESGRPEEGAELLEAALAGLADTDLARARLRVAITALIHGDAAQRARGHELAASIHRPAVSGTGWAELRAALEAVERPRG